MLTRRDAKSVTSRVGLDIGSHTINGVEVVERGSETVIRSAGSISISRSGSPAGTPDRGAVVQATKALWAQADFRSNNVVLALPPEAVYAKWLHLEAANEEELDHTARTAAVRGAPFPVHDAVVDYRILLSRGTVARNVHFVMLVAASASAIDRLLDIAEGAGVDPVAVDVGAAAALRSLGTHRQAGSPLWSGQPVAHCIVGARNTIITVVRAGALEFARTVPIGGNEVTECIAEAAGVSWLEAEAIKTAPGARLVEGRLLLSPRGGEQLRVDCEPALGRLARETMRSLKFFRSQFAEGSYLGMIGAVTLSGGGALLKGLDMCLQEQGIEATGVINPFAGLSVAAEGAGIQHVGEGAAAYTTAVGLALGDYSAAQTNVPGLPTAA